uniref:PAN domain protein n=1 Tax=Romanomermis culicivorax TaxID=13658 RepID=A0A915L282_ROMCU
MDHHSLADKGKSTKMLTTAVNSPSQKPKVLIVKTTQKPAAKKSSTGDDDQDKKVTESKLEAQVFNQLTCNSCKINLANLRVAPTPDLAFKEKVEIVESKPKPKSLSTKGEKACNHDLIFQIQAPNLNDLETKFMTTAMSKSVEHCAKMCYGRGCVRALFSRQPPFLPHQNGTCTFFFDEKEQCSDNKRMFMRFEAKDRLLQISCIKCELNLRSKNLINQSGLVAPTSSSQETDLVDVFASSDNDAESKIRCENLSFNFKPLVIDANSSFNVTALVGSVDQCVKKCLTIAGGRCNSAIYVPTADPLLRNFKAFCHMSTEPRTCDRKGGGKSSDFSTMNNSTSWSISCISCGNEATKTSGEKSIMVAAGDNKANKEEKFVTKATVVHQEIDESENTLTNTTVENQEKETKQSVTCRATLSFLASKSHIEEMVPQMDDMGNKTLLECARECRDRKCSGATFLSTAVKGTNSRCLLSFHSEEFCTRNALELTNEVDKSTTTLIQCIVCKSFAEKSEALAQLKGTNPPIAKALEKSIAFNAAAPPAGGGYGVPVTEAPAPPPTEINTVATEVVTQSSGPANTEATPPTEGSIPPLIETSGAATPLPETVATEGGQIATGVLIITEATAAITTTAVQLIPITEQQTSAAQTAQTEAPNPTIQTEIGTQPAGTSGTAAPPVTAPAGYPQPVVPGTSAAPVTAGTEVTETATEVGTSATQGLETAATETQTTAAGPLQTSPPAPPPTQPATSGPTAETPSAYPAPVNPSSPAAAATTIAPGTFQTEAPATSLTEAQTEATAQTEPVVPVTSGPVTVGTFPASITPQIEPIQTVATEPATEEQTVATVPSPTEAIPPAPTEPANPYGQPAATSGAQTGQTSPVQVVTTTAAPAATSAPAPPPTTAASGPVIIVVETTAPVSVPTAPQTTLILTTGTPAAPPTETAPTNLPVPYGGTQTGPPSVKPPEATSIASQTTVQTTPVIQSASPQAETTAATQPTLSTAVISAAVTSPAAASTTAAVTPPPIPYGARAARINEPQEAAAAEKPRLNKEVLDNRDETRTTTSDVVGKSVTVRSWSGPQLFTLGNDGSLSTHNCTITLEVHQVNPRLNFNYVNRTVGVDVMQCAAQCYLDGCSSVTYWPKLGSQEHVCFFAYGSKNDTCGTTTALSSVISRKPFLAQCISCTPKDLLPKLIKPPTINQSNIAAVADNGPSRRTTLPNENDLLSDIIEALKQLASDEDYSDSGELVESLETLRLTNYGNDTKLRTFSALLKQLDDFDIVQLIDRIREISARERLKQTTSSGHSNRPEPVTATVQAVNGDSCLIHYQVSQLEPRMLHGVRVWENVTFSRSVSQCARSCYLRGCILAQFAPVREPDDLDAQPDGLCRLSFDRQISCHSSSGEQVTAYAPKWPIEIRCVRCLSTNPAAKRRLRH